MSCGVGCRYGLELVLLRLWHRPATIALIQPLAWELPYAVGLALKKRKRKKEKTKHLNGQKNAHGGMFHEKDRTLGIPRWPRGLGIWCCHC